jgi:hypothetical protein
VPLLGERRDDPVIAADDERQIVDDVVDVNDGGSGVAFQPGQSSSPRRTRARADEVIE